MQLSLQDVLRKILTIAHYPKDQDAFIKEFETLNFVETILQIYKDLPQAQQEVVKAHSEDVEVLRQYIPQDAYKEVLTKVTINALRELQSSISPMLNLHQKKKINALLSQEISLSLPL